MRIHGANRRVAVVVVLATIFTAATLIPAYGTCTDPLGTCSTPCPSEHCHGDDDCEPGSSCVRYGTVPEMICTPSQCDCDDPGVWWCTADCAEVCVPDAILLPANSPWGLALLALLALSLGTGLILSRRRPS